MLLFDESLRVFRSQYLRYYADSNVFSAAITPQVAASSLRAPKLIQARPEIRKKL